MFKLSPALLGVGVAALIATGTATLQTYRLNTATTALKDAKAQVVLFALVANERAQDLRARDQLITDQSASIAAIKANSDAARATYVAGLSAANRSALAHESRAAELSQLPEVVPDDRCEAARSLIEDEMSNVR